MRDSVPPFATLLHVTMSSQGFFTFTNQQLPVCYILHRLYSLKRLSLGNTVLSDNLDSTRDCESYNNGHLHGGRKILEVRSSKHYMFSIFKKSE